MNVIFNFDNINVGEIDNIISEKFYNDKNKLFKIKLNNDLILNVFKYKNDFPLILDEVKPLFNMLRTKYNIVIIDKIKYYAYKNLNNTPLKEYVKHNVIKNTMKHIDLQQIFIFNYLMCINSNFENNIYVFPSYDRASIIDTKYEYCVSFKVINEKSYKYDSSDSEISKRILKEWFNNSIDDFLRIASKMVRSMDPDLLRFELLKIVRKYNDDYVSWVNSVYNKVREVRGMLNV
jgi:hypothetical protein